MLVSRVFSGADRSNNNDQNSEHERKSPLLHSIRSENPFDILGIDKSGKYSEAKRRFVELALQHHPDQTLNEQNKETNVQSFIRFRQAFEALREDHNGMALERDDNDDENSKWSSDEEFNAWFYEETGHADIMFRMDMVTRKEVIDVYRNQAHGGLDRGGLWEMARRMAEQEEMLKDQKKKFKKPNVGLEDSSDSAPSSSVRWRRKRNG